ncbi:divergent PAP2 family protein [Patescibacteria group bacterium]
MFPFNIVIIPIIVFIIAQGTKVATRAVKHPLDIRSWAAYGGMPSAHTAFTVSMATLAGLVAGFNSVPFMIAAVMALIIIRDALGLRMHLSAHSKILNRVIKDAQGVDQKKYPFLGERLGHTGPEVIVGAIIGALLTWGLWYLLV